MLMAWGHGSAWGASPLLLSQDLAVQVWTKQQGLPDNSVTAVLQTRDGYLWIGTPEGLARFDGVRFVSVSPLPHHTRLINPLPLSTSLTHSASGEGGSLKGGEGLYDTLHVTALCEDSTGRLWIGTQGEGLFSYSNGGMARYRVGTNTLNDSITSIAEDGARNLWVGTPMGLVLLEGNQVKTFSTKDGLPGDFVSNIHVARSGTVWITTRGGMCQFKNGKIFPVPFQTDSPGRNPESLGVYEDRTGNLWAFGDTYLVNLTEGKHLNHFGGGENLSSLRIWSLCEGRQGELWIGTSGKGLYCFTDDKFMPITLRNGGFASDVRALCEDREGNLWLGTQGGGLVRLQQRNVRMLDAGDGLPNRPTVCLALDPQGHAWAGFDRSGLYANASGNFERVSGESGMESQNLVSSIAITPDAGVWVGTPGSGVYRIIKQRAIHFGTADGLSDDTVLSVAADGGNNVWAGTISGGLNRIASNVVTRFGTENGLPEQSITTILPTQHGKLWLGYGDGGVVRGEPDPYQFKTILEPSVLRGKAVRAMHEDSTGRIWIGTEGGSLACILTGRYLNWNLSLATSGDSILGILSDADGDLWLGTSRAIYHVTRSDLDAALSGNISIRCQMVFDADSVPSMATSYGWPGAMKSSDGKLWFGMPGGIVTLDPQRLAVDSNPLPALIEDVMVNGSSILHPNQPTDRVEKIARFPSSLRSLEFQFTALNFSAPEKVRFRHRLDGFDPDWVDGGSERSVRYGRLPFGRYVFRVQAGSSDTWYESGAAFGFIVPTPAWRTEWALAIYGLLAVILVASIARLVSNRRLRHRLAVLAQQQSLERERMRIAQDMHDEIGSKLTKISYMSERAKGELQGQEAVARKLDSIALTSRDLLQSLDEIVWAVNPHNDTLEHLAAYLGHYATEYLQNTAVECELHIPQGLPHHPLSAETRHNLFLAFEEALNNALKHGRASRIRVDMRISPGQFEIRVADNGCGFDTGTMIHKPSDADTHIVKRVGNGLRNLHQRLTDVGGKCSVISSPGQGTTVSLTVPFTSRGH